MKIKESKIVQFVGAKAQDGKWRWSTITETTYNSRNFQFIIFSFLTLSLPTKEVFPVNGQNWQVANLPVVDFRFQPPEMPIPKPLNTKLSVFLFVDWFSFSSWKSWTLLSFSVLAAIIRESSDKLPCIENREGFTVHSSSWPSGTKGERPVSSWWLYQTQVKNILFFHVSCYGFSQGWKSVYNTIIYMIITIIITSITLSLTFRSAQLSPLSIYHQRRKDSRKLKWW